VADQGREFAFSEVRLCGLTLRTPVRCVGPSMNVSFLCLDTSDMVNGNFICLDRKRNERREVRELCGLVFVRVLAW